MFKISLSPSYFATVNVDLLDAAGKTSRQVFEVEFRRLSQTELEATNKGVQSGAIDDNQLLNSLVLGWRGVCDENGDELPFNPSNLGRLLDVHPVRPTLVKTFYESLSGARAKN